MNQLSLFPPPIQKQHKVRDLSFFFPPDRICIFSLSEAGFVKVRELRGCTVEDPGPKKSNNNATPSSAAASTSKKSRLRGRGAA